MWKTAANTEAVEMDGEWVILDGDRYVVTKLNEVGGFIWERLKQGSTLEMLVRGLTGEYDIEPEQARADIEAFVDRLIGCGLVEHVA